MSIVDYNSINKHIKELHTKNLKLDESTGAKYIESLRSSILGSNKLDKINSIVVLAKILEFLPPSDLINGLFDSKLFANIFEVASNDTVANESLRSALRISLTFLSGVIPVNRSADVFNALLVEAHNNYELLENLSNKLFDQDLRIGSNIIDFVTKLLYRSYELKEDSFIIFSVKNLMNAQFFTNLSILPDSNKAELERLGFLANLNKSVCLIKTYLMGLKLNTKIDCHHFILTDLLEAITYSINESGTATVEEYTNYGLTATPSKFIVDNYSVLTVVQMKCFLKSPNITFKKQYFEHTMFANENSYFPLGNFGHTISRLLDNVDIQDYPNLEHIFYAFNNEIYYMLMFKALNIWISSRAETEDYDKTMKVLGSVLQLVDELLENLSLDEALESLNEMEYDQLKKYQIERLKKSKNDSWSPLTANFNKDIANQALNFVKDQRFLELSKGSWVYTENPTEVTKANKKQTHYFVILSSNNQSLIYKEFPKRTAEAPNIDKDGTKIEFNQILKIDSTPLTSDATSSKLISINSRLNINKISITTKSYRIFEFFVDTRELLYIWLDGSRMLINDNSDLSDDTKYQVDSLTKIRSEIQLIDLDEKTDITEEFKFKEADLAGLTAGFYYN
ncbi:hypothetical protein CANARDRAFT_8528 [[Candida] arabinofermentans NRRL YB-2248]|uniref:PH domain-containing protein n=1 Tax=[Candida] arabinofermentans NRRL YB-2248 TaxID=983967 RepID=A0A1E4SYG8_9ASCO|nr:hypothetical protein CANARDRAFT_8528 [[Candida] arabinofermentans NRRL YB-2248]